MIRILIADDQDLFVQGMSMILESQDDFELVGTASNGEEAVRAVAELNPDVVLMDIRMPVLDGIRATHAIREAHPIAPPHILVLTTVKVDRAVVEAIKAGASGFLLKDARSEFLMQSIRAVADGQRVIAPADTFDLLAAVSSTVGPPDEEVLEPLTERERAVFMLVAEGLSNSEIADREFIAETTVKTHVRSILSKLGLASRVQVVALAHEHELLRKSNRESPARIVSGT